MQFTLRDILNVVFRYSRALTTFWAITIIAIAVFYSQTQTLYDSKARILVTLGSEAEGRAEYLNGKNLQLVQREQQLHDEQQILEGHDVLLATAKWIAGDSTPPPLSQVSEDQLEQVRRFYSGQEPQATLLLRTTSRIMKLLAALGKRQSHDKELEGITRQLFDNLSVNAIFGSDALDISFRYRDPQVAQTVLRLVIAAYYSHHIAIFQSTAESDLLKSQLDRSVSQYHERLGQFSDYMTHHQLYNDDFQVNALIDQREKIEMALNEAKAEGASSAARLVSLKALDQSLQQIETYSTTEIPNKYRDMLTTKLGDAVLEEQTLLTRHPKGSRAYEEAQSQIDELHRLIEKEPATVVGQTETRRLKASELVESEIVSVAEAQQGSRARIEQYGQNLHRIDAVMASYTTDLKGFDSLKLDVAFAKRESEQMGQAFVDSQLRNLTAQSAITDVSIIDAPSLDSHAASPKGQLVAAAAAGLLIMGSFAVILACAGLDTTIADSRSARIRLGMPVSAILPVAKSQDMSRAEFMDSFSRDNHGEFARLYQTIRRESAEASIGNVILFAESSPKEGSSLVAYGLARFLCRDAHKKIGFIDCSENSILDSPGVRNGALDEPTPLAWPKDIQVASGTMTTSLSAISKLSGQYDYIVVAAGALKNATDVLTLSSIVSAAFLILEAEKTRRAAARYSLDLLQTYGFKGIGLILNKRIFYVPGWLMRFV